MAINKTYTNNLLTIEIFEADDTIRAVWRGKSIEREPAEFIAPILNGIIKSSSYKNLQPYNQDQVPQFGLPFLDGWSYEEWFGIASLGNGKNSAFTRQLRPAYYTMKSLWNKKT